MKRPVIVAIACVALALAGWMLLQSRRGPLLAGYQVQARPLVQTVVATGRVVAVFDVDSFRAGVFDGADREGLEALLGGLLSD